MGSAKKLKPEDNGETPQPGPRKNARLRFGDDGEKRIVAPIVAESQDRIVVEQALPFLSLYTPVRDGEDRAARIEWVELRMDGIVPTLRVEVVYDRDHSRPAPRKDSTAQLTHLSAYAPAGKSAKAGKTAKAGKKQRDATVSFDQPSKKPTSVIPVGEPDATGSEPPASSEASASEGPRSETPRPSAPPPLAPSLATPSLTPVAPPPPRLPSIPPPIPEDARLPPGATPSQLAVPTGAREAKELEDTDREDKGLDRALALFERGAVAFGQAVERLAAACGLTL